eukprot:TRINITY_DN60544_c0_g1_i1.p1 TRINITY_DN60544_c0_g1~~TRINITY_DN60544_c0_g1_i1.p1  ORF type:complete len:484 (+),score=114.72 TRINITY_DN60544_c0_g1_i1:33-1484(+)
MPSLLRRSGAWRLRAARGMGPSRAAVAAVALLLKARVASATYEPPEACSEPAALPYTGDTRTYGYGVNWYGNMGFDKNRTTEPKMVYIGSDKSVQLQKMSGGFMHTAALLRDSRLYVTGDGTKGQLALGNSVRRPYKRFTPVEEVVERGKEVPEFIRPIGAAEGRGIIDVCAGWAHTCAVIADDPTTETAGKLYCAGSNEFGQLGVGERWPQRPGIVQTVAALAPVEDVDGNLLVNVKMVACGADHSLAVDTDNVVWAWGRGYDGQLGNGLRNNSDVLLKVQGLPAAPVQQVDAGVRSSYVLFSDGMLYGWGLNKKAQLGIGGREDREGLPTRQLTPVNIAHPQGLRFESISAGAYHVAAIDSELKALTWGAAVLGQTGLPDFPMQKRDWVAPLPKRVPALENVNIQQVCAGFKHTLFLTTCGEVLATGSDVFSQMGNGLPDPLKLFREMQPVANNRLRQWKLKARRIDCGSYWNFVTSDTSF